MDELKEMLKNLQNKMNDHGDKFIKSISNS